MDLQAKTHNTQTKAISKIHLISKLSVQLGRKFNPGFTNSLATD